ncbi:dihydrolipoamide acetyltransferase family protein [Herbiconiux solani]|uniref:dihydrolipoamide acetyltransferase family protein n=1 Tax=Herbiconiux solani TaxID=661329 RepID=UPI00082476C7|nr:dihydrolipoamide acetyltransferase family protein [Herbiconiux solani]
MAIIIRMPSVLAGSEEAAIASWLVEPGQSIAVGDPLAEIETEKAVVEYNSEDAGIVGRVLLEPGESGEIGAPIAVLIAEGEGDAEIDALLGGGGGGAGAADAAAGSATDAAAGSASDAAPATGPSGATPTPEPGADGTAPAIPEGDEAERDPDGATPVVEAASQVEAEKAAVPEVPGSATAGTTGATGGSDSAASAAAPASASVSASTEAGSRLFVSPIARKLAKEKGIDPASISGTGPDGRIVRRDIENAAPAAQVTPTAAPATEAATPAASTPAPTGSAPSAPAQPAAPAPASASDASAEWHLVPHTGMRKAIARRLTESKATVPHFYLTTECRVDDLIALRKQVNETSGVRVSINDFVVKAVAAAFAEVPEANVTWSDEGMRVHRAVDIAVAVATEGGLVTPVVRGVDTKSLSAVSASIAELVGRAKEKKLKQHELEGGSFSVSNLGMYGTLEFSAILNPPQSGILAVGAATQQAVVVDGEIRVATVMRCTLSVDHRAVDGALAARWLAAFTSRIENPLSILL